MEHDRSEGAVFTHLTSGSTFFESVCAVRSMVATFTIELTHEANSSSQQSMKIVVEPLKSSAVCVPGGEFVISTSGAIWVREPIRVPSMLVRMVMYPSE